MARVTIEKLVIGGSGLARLSDGKVVLVPHVLPGEEVVVRPISSKKNYIEARAVTVLRPSADRIPPPCHHFPRCGGCDFQHVRFARQVELKNQMLLEQIDRSGLKGSESFMLPPLSAPQPFQYRQRIRLHVGKDGELGFHRHHSHEVELIRSCLLATPRINEVLDYLVNAPPFAKVARLTTSVELLLSPVEERVVIFGQMTRRPRPAERRALEEIAEGSVHIKSVVAQAVDSGMTEVFAGSDCRDELSLLSFSHALPDGAPLTMTIEAGGFCQVNSEQNTQLIALVLDWARLEASQRVLDLFCGMGNFSLPVARQVASVVGMDLQRSAIRSAERNAKINGMANCLFFQRAARQGAEQLAQSGERFDLVLLDPPRQGCAEVIPLLPPLGATRIMYISCDPATLCRDLQLLEQHGYAVERMKLVDMFPQTRHLETLVSLTRSG